MVKKKRPGPSKKGKTSYADELRYKKMLGYEIVSLWTAQLVLDTLAIVLNDPDVMRSHTLGANRFGSGWSALPKRSTSCGKTPKKPYRKQMRPIIGALR